MKTIEIAVTPRTETGKGANRKLRVKGQIPACVYGASKKNFVLATNEREMTKILFGHNENAIITLKGGGVEGKHVLIKDWDRDIMTRRPIHVDFYEIDLTKSVKVRVPLHFVGKAKGVTEGGLVQPIVREIEVECLPTAIPEFIDVDVTPLGLNDSLHIDELHVPENVKKVFQENYTIVTVTIVKEEVVAVVDPTAAATLAEPEVIAKGKKEEGEEGAAAAPAKGGAAAPAKGAAPAKAAPAKGDKK